MARSKANAFLKSAFCKASRLSLLLGGWGWQGAERRDESNKDRAHKVRTGRVDVREAILGCDSNPVKTLERLG
ncbi:MAG TPA: hypothetical protein VKD00_11225 [Methyloceanibacter sp.]|nr:hypothetical protein [Methyloceanibacter sp.]